MSFNARPERVREQMFLILRAWGRVDLSHLRHQARIPVAVVWPPRLEIFSTLRVILLNRLFRVQETYNSAHPRISAAFALAHHFLITPQKQTPVIPIFWQEEHEKLLERGRNISV